MTSLRTILFSIIDFAKVALQSNGKDFPGISYPLWRSAVFQFLLALLIAVVLMAWGKSIYMKKETLLVKEDTPTYKIINLGSRSVSNIELISSIIGGDPLKALATARKIFLHANQSLNELAKMPIFELQIASGLSANKCAQIIASIELGRRHQLETVSSKSAIRSSHDIFEMFYNKFSDLPVEEFWVAFLNKANIVVAHTRQSIGGISGTVVDVKIILKEALYRNASAMILMHNHPSGNLKPSDADLSITKKLKEAATSLDIMLLDHVIMGDKSYYSFADNGNI